MIKHLGAAMLAVCSLAVGMPAASASHANVYCRINAIALSDVPPGTTYDGYAQGYIVGNLDETVSIRCVVKVNNAIRAFTEYGSGRTAATTAGRVSFFRSATEAVSLCAQYTGYHGAGETCFPATADSSAVRVAPDEEVAELIDSVESRLGCNDGLDNDLDTYPDTTDPGCASSTDSDERGTTTCDDGVDNDGDGFADYPTDGGCTGPADGDEYNSLIPVLTLLGCGDGLDNDLDGTTDANDPGCSGPSDADERGNAACDDGRDNDGDRWFDQTDPGCAGPADTDEYDPACSDGADNDADLEADYPNDPGCSSPADGNEHGGPCEDGLDNDGDGQRDETDPGCTGPADSSERGALPCDDGLDNDSDGKTDYPADDGCRVVADPNETTIP